MRFMYLDEAIACFVSSFFSKGLMLAATLGSNECASCSWIALLLHGIHDAVPLYIDVLIRRLNLVLFWFGPWVPAFTTPLHSAVSDT